jgi:hypothetical protein
LPNPIRRSAKNTMNGWESPQNNCNRAAAMENVDLSARNRLMKNGLHFHVFPFLDSTDPIHIQL